MATGSTYSKRKADYAVAFIQALKHTKGRRVGNPFKLLDWAEEDRVRPIRHPQGRWLQSIHDCLRRVPEKARQVRAGYSGRLIVSVWGW